MGCQRALSQSTNFLTIKVLGQVGYLPREEMHCNDILIDGKNVLDLSKMGKSVIFKTMVKKLNPK